MTDDITQIKPVKFLVCIDGSQESRVALRFACIKAKKRGGLVDVLHVTEPAEVQPLFSIADKVREERREEAEELLKQICNDAYESTGITVSLILREGKIGDAIIAAIQEDTDVNMLVLGVAASHAGHGKLMSWLAGQMGEKMLIPLMLVPGNLTDQQIEELS